MENSKGFLLDTHIFIWWMEKKKRLTKDAINFLNNPQNQIFLSVASIWEMIIKKQKKKLRIPSDLEGGIQSSDFRILPIELSHVLEIEKLPYYHKDPFDRILIAQAKAENFVILTDDAKIKKYNVQNFPLSS